MPLNVLGGPLEFDAVINFDSITESLKELSDNLSKSFQASPSTPALDLLKNKILDVARQITSFQEQLANTKDPVAIQKLNDSLFKASFQFTTLKSLLENIPTDPIDNVSHSLDQMGQKQLAPLTRLRQIRNELANLINNGVDKGSPQFQTLLGEATELEHAIKNVHRELELTSSNVAGVEALQQGFRGLLGGVEAAASVMGLFNDNEADTAKITKNLVVVMGLLNGLEELGSVLNKRSALNVYLEQLMRKQNAAAATAEAVAITESSAAKEASIAATEGATVAQEGLNIAMAANPVGIILGSIVALYGVYQLLSDTVFKATDAEHRHKAAIEATNAAQKKAVDTIAEEQGSLETLLVTATNVNTNQDQRIEALGTLRSKYPQYLSDLRLETLYTDQAAVAIEKTTKLIRDKAVAAAAEDIYKEKIKKVLELQVELNKVQTEGATFFEKFKAGFLSRSTITDATVINRLQGQIKNATNEANGAFDAERKALDEIKR
jgi:hypothetical protein